MTVTWTDFSANAGVPVFVIGIDFDKSKVYPACTSATCRQKKLLIPYDKSILTCTSCLATYAEVSGKIEQKEHIIIWRILCGRKHNVSCVSEAGLGVMLKVEATVDLAEMAADTYSAFRDTAERILNLTLPATFDAALSPYDWETDDVINSFPIQIRVRPQLANKVLTLA